MSVFWEKCMNRNSPIHHRLPTSKLWIAAALVLLQFGCSANNDPSLQYQSGSTLNPAGPSAPDNSPLIPSDPRNPLNWYSNGDIESGVEPWFSLGGGNLSRTTMQKYSGSYSLLISGRTAASHAPAMPLLNTLPAGQYEASVWVRLVAGSEPAAVTLTLKTRTSTTDTYTTVHSAEANAGGWTRLSGTFQNRSPGRWDELVLYVESANETASYYVDDLTVVSLNNVIINGDIESGIQPWRTQGSALTTQASEQRHSGDYSLLVTQRSENWHGPVMDLPLLSEGRSYQASVWVRLAAGTPSTRLNLTLKRTVAGSNAEYIQLGSEEATATAWVELAGSFTHVASGTLVEHYLYIESTEAGAAASFYVDDLELAIPTELVTNGGLESGQSGWGPFGPVELERISADAHSGVYSLLVTNRSENWQGASFTVAAPQAGDIYELTCYVRMAPENPASSVAMTIKLRDGLPEIEGDYGIFIEVARTDATAEGWVQLKGTYLHNPDGTETEFTPYIQASEATAEYLIDSCSATRQ
jgi:hypothetical protein